MADDYKKKVKLIKLTADDLLRKYANGERNFRNITIRNVDIIDANLEGADFRSSDLSFSYFYNVNFKGADFTNAKIKKSIFQNTYLTRANFRNADLSLSFFSHATLKNTNFTKSNLTHAYFYKSDFCGADFRGTKLKGITFNETNSENIRMLLNDNSNRMICDIFKL